MKADNDENTSRSGNNSGEKNRANTKGQRPITGIKVKSIPNF